jgi:hypothetical protein
VIQTQLPDSVTKASVLSRIQQQVWERTKFRPQKGVSAKFTTNSVKTDSASQTPTTPLWKERQLRDYRRANNMCYFCGDKFDANHLQKCTKRNKPQLNVLALNDLDAELSEDTLNQLEVEDVLTAEMG